MRAIKIHKVPTAKAKTDSASDNAAIDLSICSPPSKHNVGTTALPCSFATIDYVLLSFSQGLGLFSLERVVHCWDFRR